MFKQAVIPGLQVCFITAIQDQANIRDLLLLEFLGKKLVRIAGSQPPIQPA